MYGDALIADYGSNYNFVAFGANNDYIEVKH